MYILHISVQFKGGGISRCSDILRKYCYLHTCILACFDHILQHCVHPLFAQFSNVFASTWRNQLFSRYRYIYIRHLELQGYTKIVSELYRSCEVDRACDLIQSNLNYPDMLESNNLTYSKPGEKSKHFSYPPVQTLRMLELAKGIELDCTTYCKGSIQYFERTRTSDIILIIISILYGVIAML